MFWCWLLVIILPLHLLKVKASINTTDICTFYQAEHASKKKGHYFRNIIWWKSEPKNVNEDVIISSTYNKIGCYRQKESNRKTKKKELGELIWQLVISEQELTFTGTLSAEGDSLIGVRKITKDSTENIPFFDITKELLNQPISEPPNLLTRPTISLKSVNQVLIVPQLGRIHPALFLNVDDLTSSFSSFQPHLGPTPVKAILVNISRYSLDTSSSTNKQSISTKEPRIMSSTFYSWRLATYRMKSLAHGISCFTFNGQFPSYEYGLQAVSAACSFQVENGAFRITLTGQSNKIVAQVIMKLNTEKGLVELKMAGRSFNVALYQKVLHSKPKIYSDELGHLLNVIPGDALLIFRSGTTIPDKIGDTPEDLDNSAFIKKFLDEEQLLIQVVTSPFPKSQHILPDSGSSHYSPFLNPQLQPSSSSPRKIAQLVDSYDVNLTPSTSSSPSLQFSRVHWTTDRLEAFPVNVVFDHLGIVSGPFLLDYPATFCPTKDWKHLPKVNKEETKYWFACLMLRYISSRSVTILTISKSAKVQTALIRKGELQILNFSSSSSNSSFEFTVNDGDIIQIVPDAGSYIIKDGSVGENFSLSRYSQALSSKVTLGPVTALFIKIQKPSPSKEKERTTDELKEIFHDLLLSQFWFSSLLAGRVEFLYSEVKSVSNVLGYFKWHHLKGTDCEEEEDEIELNKNDKSGLLSLGRFLSASYGRYGITQSSNFILISDILCHPKSWSRQRPTLQTSKLGENYFEITLDKKLIGSGKGRVPWKAVVVRDGEIHSEIYNKPERQEIDWKHGDRLALIPLGYQITNQEIRSKLNSNIADLLPSSFHELVGALEQGFGDSDSWLIAELRVKRQHQSDSSLEITEEEEQYDNRLDGTMILRGLPEDIVTEGNDTMKGCVIFQDYDPQAGQLSNSHQLSPSETKDMKELAVQFKEDFCLDINDDDSESDDE